MKQTNKEHLIKFRAKNLELGRKRVEFYLTKAEHEAIKTKIKSLREKIMNNKATGFNSEDGDFMANRQTMPPVEVWNINGAMCVALNDDPVYITKEQAMKFFNLKECDDE